MKRLTEFFKMIGRKAWQFFGDDRLFLMFGAVHLYKGFNLPQEEYLRAALYVLSGLLLIVICWRDLEPKRKPAEQPEVHP